MNHPSKKAAATLPLVRCAIYTRKSTEEGLEQEFNSLDAQRESAEAFVRSQTHEGWTCLPDRYDDGGFTGGNMERPALQRQLADIQAGKIDCVICYKVDRLSRSLLDFAKMMETFEQHGVSFVSITQQFNSATSMGRLVLNVLLSFAQFEREIIAERTRDKMAATRRKGKWSGGTPVLKGVCKWSVQGCIPKKCQAAAVAACCLSSSCGEGGLTGRCAFNSAAMSGERHCQSMRRSVAIVSSTCSNVCCHRSVRTAARRASIPSACSSSHNRPGPFSRRLITRRIALSIAPLPRATPRLRKDA